jgi:hypothetical protein
MFRGNMGGCQLGAAATGVRCTGPGCSEVSFQCCKLGTKIAEEWGEWFSSAGWERNDNIDQGFAELIQCQGEKCSMMRIKYATYQGIVKSPRPQNGVPICYSPGDWISSQEPNNQQICYNNYYLTGLSCKGEFCDSLRITCCQAQKNN